jgi:hypothetical protein
LFPFGYGLSYTPFSHSHLTVSPSTDGRQPFTVRFSAAVTVGAARSNAARASCGSSHHSKVTEFSQGLAVTGIKLLPVITFTVVAAL